MYLPKINACETKYHLESTGDVGLQVRLMNHGRLDRIQKDQAARMVSRMFMLPEELPVPKEVHTGV